jgi:hypothetical protein
MTDLSGYAKKLALPAGFDAPRLPRYDDLTAHAITRDDLGADARVRRPLTEELPSYLLALRP